MKIELDLTDEEWCELANSLTTRAIQVERLDDDEELDGEEWAKTLRRTYHKVAEKLDEYGIPH